MLNRNRLYRLIAVLSAAGYALTGVLYFRGVRAIAGGSGVGEYPGDSVVGGGNPGALIDSIEFCLFKGVTGVACPSCGTGRSIVMILEGHVLSAAMINPLGLLAAMMLVVLPAWVAVDLLGRSDSLYRFYRKAEVTISGNRWLVVLLAALLAANWIWNITKGV